MSILVVGLSHRTTPVSLLERATVSGDALVKLLHDVHRDEDVAEVLVVSTCNRVEVYAHVARFHGGVTAITDVLGGTLPVADEAALSVFSSVTGAVSGYLHYLAVACSWAESQGVPRDDAERFLRGLFAGLSPAIADESIQKEEAKVKPGKLPTKGGKAITLINTITTFDEPGTFQPKKATRTVLDLPKRP